MRQKAAHLNGAQTLQKRQVLWSNIFRPLFTKPAYLRAVKRLLENVDWTQVLGLSGLAITVLLLWDTPLVYPLKILVVFFHELSHGLAAVISGGAVHEIEISERIGGLARSSGGNRFLILSAGYLGSLLWGCTVLVLSSRTSRSKGIAIVLGAILLGASIWLVRPILGFGFVFGVSSAGLLLFLGLRCHRDLSELALRCVGVTSCLYAIYDIKSDVLDRTVASSDASRLGELTGVPGFVWGALWIVVALLTTSLFVLISCKKRAMQGDVVKD